MSNYKVLDDLDEREYHSHPTSLSVTGAKVLLKCPAKYQWQRTNPVHKDVFDFGSAAHKLVLGVGAELVEVKADSWRTKKAQEAKAAARAQGAIPLLTDDLATVHAMADKLSEHTLATMLLSDGRPEVSMFAEDSATGVLRRGRLDWLGVGIISDYKTARSSEPDRFVKDAYNFGYHMQAAWYLDLAADCELGTDSFVFIAQEKEPPYVVTMVELPPDLVEAGRLRNAAALERFRDCTKSGIWPGYTSDREIARPEHQSWMLRKDYA